MPSTLCNAFSKLRGYIRTCTREVFTQDALQRAHSMAKAKQVKQTLGHDDLSFDGVDLVVLGVAREVTLWRVAWLLEQSWR